MKYKVERESDALGDYWWTTLQVEVGDAIVTKKQRCGLWDYAEVQFDGGEVCFDELLLIVANLHLAAVVAMRLDNNPEIEEIEI